MHGGSFIESIRAIGCNAIGMGVPWWQAGGGENHPDGIITGQTMTIGGEVLVKDGRPSPAPRRRWSWSAR